LAGDVRGARVAVSVDLGRKEIEPLQARLIDEASRLLKSLGCTLVAADPPPLEGGDELEPGVWAYSGDHYGAAESMIPGFWEKHADDLTDYARPIYDAGRRALAWQYRRILRRNRAYVERMREWFVDYDFLLAPLASPAPTLTEAEEVNRTRSRGGRMGYCAPFNVSYNPAAAVPFGFSDEALPVSIQIVGRHGDDAGVLRLSALIEAARPWAHRWPELARKTP
jgi:aspartyl-tRNA(Asn)/glutamyl-tRNA(Gln) amidotransferase subunit A